MLSARVVGGLQMVDGGEADDKIVAVPVNDLFSGAVEEINGPPSKLIERLTHYFSTYKLVPGRTSSATIAKIYDREHAAAIIRASMEVYQDEYGG